MFGYLKPYNNELKGKYTSEYRRHYCTLCHGLRVNLGLLSVLLLNYECTFLFLFLDALTEDTSSEACSFRCPVNPLKKHSTQVSSAILEYSSFINYHLAVLKAYDGLQDSHGIKKVVCKVLYWLLTHNKKYTKLRNMYSTTADKTEQLCSELYELEVSQDLDFDQCSVKMGNVLREIINGFPLGIPESTKQPALEFATHLGMWTYLIDAYDDFEKDETKGTFNPLVSFSEGFVQNNTSNTCLQAGELMLGMMTANLRELLKSISICKHTEIIENIVFYGTQNAVQVCKKKKVEKKHGCCYKKRI